MKTTWFPFILIILVLAVVYGITQGSRREEETRQPGGLPGQPVSLKEGKPEVARSAGVDPTLKQLNLTISSPANGSAVRASTVTVQGKTAALAEVFINDIETVADGSGNFSINISLDEGENYLLVVATDEQGNVAEKEITVTYDVSP